MDYQGKVNIWIVACMIILWAVQGANLVNDMITQKDLRELKNEVAGLRMLYVDTH